MASLVAVMDVAVEESIAIVCALEHAGPVFQDVLSILGYMLDSTVLLVSPVTAQDLLLNLSAVASGVDSNFTCSA